MRIPIPNILVTPLINRIRILAADITALEAEIDALVEQLYGLNAKEKKLVEGKNDHE